MRFNLRNIIIIVLFVIVVWGTGYAVYYFFFKAAPEPEPEIPDVVEPGEGLPGAGEIDLVPPEEIEDITTLPEASPIAVGGLTQVETVTPTAIVQDPTLASDGRGMQYYDAATGTFQQVLPDGTIRTFSDEVFFNVDEVTWSPDGESAILEYPDGSNIMYDFATDEQVTLPQHWTQFDFSPDGDQVAAKSIGLDPDNRWLITSDPDGTNAQAIEPLGNNEDKVTVKWSPNNQVIATSRTGQEMGLSRQQILLVGQNGENFPGLTVEGWGFDYQWTPTGDRMIYDVYNFDSNNIPTLWVTDASGSNIGANRRYLNLNTWSDKCTFSDSNTLFCAVPDYLPEGAGMQREIASGIPDTIYQIDLNTGRKSVVGKPEDAATITQISVSEDGKYIYYTDERTNRLNTMRLK